jgi:hypothetical protein
LGQDLYIQDLESYIQQEEAYIQQEEVYIQQEEDRCRHCCYQSRKKGRFTGWRSSWGRAADLLTCVLSCTT